MAILDWLGKPENIKFIGHALQQIGATGRPQMQAALQDRFMQDIESRKREQQFGGLLNNQNLNEQQRGLLQFIGPEQGAGLLAQQAFGQGQKPTGLMQNLEAAGLKPGTPEYANAIRQVLMKPQVAINQGPDLPSGFQWKDPANKAAGVAPISGGPQDPRSQSRKRPTTEAAAIAAAKNSKQEITAARSKLLSADGRLNRNELVTAALPWTSGRTTQQQVRRAIETVIRAQSGAAVPPSEIDRYMELYYPKVGDSDEGAKAKMDALERFIDGLLSGLDANTSAPGGAGEYSQEDLEFTAKKHGITVEEVKRRLQGAP